MTQNGVFFIMKIHERENADFEVVSPALLYQNSIHYASVSSVDAVILTKLMKKSDFNHFYFLFACHLSQERVQRQKGCR